MVIIYKNYVVLEIQLLQTMFRGNRPWALEKKIVFRILLYMDMAAIWSWENNYTYTFSFIPLPKV